MIVFLFVFGPCNLHVRSMSDLNTIVGLLTISFNFGFNDDLTSIKEGCGVKVVVTSNICFVIASLRYTSQL